MTPNGIEFKHLYGVQDVEDGYERLEALREGLLMPAERASERVLGSTLPEIVTAAAVAGEDTQACLELATRVGRGLPLPGQGATAARWDVLAGVSEVNLTAGRILEAHADALAILAESGAHSVAGAWGVFAAEAPGASLEASQKDAGGWILRGTKPWCSLAAELDHALVVARAGGTGQLFAVDLRQPGIRVAPCEGWVSRGLRAVPSGPVDFDGVAAAPVGGPGWYLARPGFEWGGLGVAACWYGGARGLGGSLLTRASERGDSLTDLALGSLDVALHSAAACLLGAASAIDGGRATGIHGQVLALRVRSVVADVVERSLTLVGHALGPAPLAFDEDHARRVADLTVYVRQYHAERDLARLGRALRQPA